MKAILVCAAILLSGGASLLADTSGAIRVTGSRNVSVRGQATTGGILVGGSVHRVLGIGNEGGAVRIRVISPAGRLVFCTTTHVTYPNRRPLARNRIGSFAVTVQAAPGSTIHVDDGPKC